MDSEGSVDELIILEGHVNQAKALPKCFHLPGEYANSIINAKGELVMASQEACIVEGSVDRAKNYHQYVVRKCR